MQGRTEHEKQTETWIEQKLKSTAPYLTQYMRTISRKSYTTKKAYLNYVLEFLDYLQQCHYDINDINIFADIKPSFIYEYLDHLSKTEKIVGDRVYKNGESIQCRKFYAIKSFFGFLLNDEYVQKNPCDTVEPPKVTKENEIVAMDEHEVKIFLNNVLEGVGNAKAKARQRTYRSRDYAIMTLALALGLRVTSLVEINIEDLDLINKTLVVTEKGNTTRTLRFSDNIKKVLEQWLEDRYELLGDVGIRDALFISNRKERMTSKTVRKLVEKYSEGIDKHITPHKLRSTCATNVYTATGDIYLTADVLGHKNMQNTRRYAKIVDKKREQAAEAMDKILFR